MQKIISGFLGLVLVLTVVAGVAYAAFSSQASVSGVTFATGNAALQISKTGGEDWNSTIDFANTIFLGLFPLAERTQEFDLKNNSSSVISLDLAAKLRDGVTETTPGDWDALKDKISISFEWWDVATSTYQTTGWATLNQWNTPGYPLEGGSLAPGATRWYRFHVKVADATSAEIAGKSISNVFFDFTGTQAP